MKRQLLITLAFTAIMFMGCGPSAEENKQTRKQVLETDTANEEPMLIWNGSGYTILP